MGIYISGVKGLPEQVQENKNKIKEVEEQIEGIDFEAVRQLQGQVAENTQDINNLEASIGVQNQAINGLDQRLTTAEGTITNQGDDITTLGNNVGALQTKTQEITYDEYFGVTKLHDGFVSEAGSNSLLFTANGLTLNGDFKASNVEVNGDGTFQNANGSGLHFQEGANDDEVVLVNKESGTAHDLTLHADGTLTLDGQAVGAKPLYQHNLTIYTNSSRITATIINDNNTSITDKNTIATYLFNNLANGITNVYQASGYYGEVSSTKGLVIGIFATGESNLSVRYANIDSGAQSNGTISTSFTITDTIISIA